MHTVKQVVTLPSGADQWPEQLDGFYFTCRIKGRLIKTGESLTFGYWRLLVGIGGYKNDQGCSKNELPAEIIKDCESPYFWGGEIKFPDLYLL